ncbi:MAG: glycosyltransferase family 4 protein, partial [Alphaproteobacteria bacterium]
MKVLLSAYACEPGMGSEPGVGWLWARGLARLGHEVWVLTRANNRARIEAVTLPETERPRFLYYDLPAWARRWKRGGRGVRLYYLLWQWGAYRLARRVHARERFDRVHHVTFVSVRQPSFMGRLGAPFVFGPVAGGEHAPWRLRFGCGWRGLVLDALRDAVNALVRFDPLMAATFRAAERIYVTSQQTLALVPRRFRHKADVELAIGWDGEPCIASGERVGKTTGPVRVLFVGRLVYWKGLHLGLAAFRRLLETQADARLVVVGDGPDEARLRRLAEALGVAGNIEWVPWLAREDLLAFYARHDVLLYPSLHDSGGMVVLEALAAGVPAICLDLGGPGAIVDETCGRVIATEGRSADVVARSLGEALVELASDAGLRSRLAAGAGRRVRATACALPVARIYGSAPGAAGRGDVPGKLGGLSHREGARRT